MEPVPLILGAWSFLNLGLLGKTQVVTILQSNYFSLLKTNSLSYLTLLLEQKASCIHMHVDFGQIFSPVYSHANIYLKLIEAYNVYAVWSPLPTRGWAKLLQSCLTLFNPLNCNPPGSPVHGILQARILEWISMPSSRGSSQPRDWTCISWVSWLAGGFFTTSATWEAHIRINIEIKKDARNYKHGKARGRERDIFTVLLCKRILILKHFCRAIWMGGRECLRRIRRSRVKGNGRENALRLTIHGPCNHKSIDDTPFFSQQMTKIQEVIILSLGKGMVR